MSDKNGSYTAQYSGGIPGTGVPLPQNQAEAERALTSVLSLGYKATVPIMSYYGAGGVPVLSQQLWADVELMLTHPAVSGPLSYYKAGIANVEFKVKARNPAVAQFVERMLRRFWERSLEQVQRAYEYGWTAAEVCYREEESLLVFESLFDFHPLDVYALTDPRNRYCGVSVHNVSGSSTGLAGGGPHGALRLWGPGRFPAKGFWYAHNRRYQRFYGQSQLYSAWRPWRRLAFRDGVEESLDGGFYRYLYGGWEVYYPPEDFPKADGGIDYTAARSMARQFAEQAKAGVGLAVPNLYDANGNRKWEFKKPEGVVDFTPAVNVIEYLKKEISHGIGVPPELQEAADTGSGWSGRKIPLIGFYTTQLANARSVVHAWKWQIGDPLVCWNFGPDETYEVEAHLVLPADLAGGEQGGTPGANGNGDPNKPQGGGEQKGSMGAPTDARQGAIQGTGAKPNGALTLGTETDTPSLTEAVERAASETDPNPTEAQKKSGNYRKGRVTIQGLPVVIENARGSTRSGKDGSGKPWSVEMKHHYGYVGSTESEADGDPVDVFIGPDPDSEIVYIVNQKKPDGSFDEHKAMLGFRNEEDAKQGYLDCYSPGWKGMGEVTPLTMKQFKAWAKEGHTGKPTPGQTITLALDEPEEADLAAHPAEEVLDEALAAFGKLARRVHRELLALARRGPLASVLVRARKLLEAGKPELVRLLSDTQLAALLAGMRQVGRRVKAVAREEGEPAAPPLLTPSWFGDTEGGTEEAATDRPTVALPLIEAAVNDLRQRRLLTRTQYDQLVADARMQAFTAAGVESEAVLEKVRSALTDAVAQGQTLEDFRTALDHSTETAGVLAPAHAETIFRKYVQEGYSNGQDRMLEHPVVSELFPYAAYHAVHDDRTRPEHRALETSGLQGTNVYRRDDPVFQMFRPPWDWNCRCGWTVLSVRDAAARGIEEAQRWQETGQPPLHPAFVEIPPFMPDPSFRSVLLSLDREGHEHGQHGRFVSKGGSTATASARKTTSSPTAPATSAKKQALASVIAQMQQTPAGRQTLARGATIAEKIKEGLQSGVQAALDAVDTESRGGISLLSGALASRDPQTAAQGAASLFNAVFQCVHEEVFEAALAQHSMPGAHAVGVVAAKAAATAETALLKAVAWAWRKATGATTLALGDDTTAPETRQEESDLTPADKKLLSALVQVAQKTVAEVFRQAGIKTPPQQGAELAGRILAKLTGAAMLGTDTDSAPDVQHLAEAYAALWNALEDHGDEVPPEEIAAADAELDESGWHLVKVYGQPWRAMNALELEGVELATEKAPAGGVIINGKHYRGGQFIPARDVVNMTAEQKQKLHEAQAAAKAKRAARGPVDADRLHARTSGYGTLTAGEQKAAESRLRAVHAHHGELTLHRLEEMADQAERLLARAGGNRVLEAQARRELAHLNHMIGRAKEGVQRKATAPEKPSVGKVYNVATHELHVDPDRFQYKLNVDRAAGVTQELKSVRQWNPDFAGVVSVWQDPSDGKSYVVNGHHRRELAGRLGVDDMAVRYIKARDAKEARGIGALINIAEGRGTAVDAAKFMRDAGVSLDDMEKHGVSLKGKLAADAATLTKLSDRAFDRLARGTLDETKALAVAKHLDDHGLQDQLFGLLEKREDEGKDLSPRVIEEMARQMAETPKTKTTEHTLFGDIESEESLFVPRAEVAASIRAGLAREVNDWLAVSSKRRAEKVGGAGNVLNIDENKKIADQAEQVKNVFDQLANRKGAISEALNAAAEEYHQAKTKKERENVKQRALESVRDAVLREAGFDGEERRQADAAAEGERAGGGGAADTTEPEASAASVPPDAGRGDTGEAGLEADSKPPEPGFTGEDSLGRKWENDKLVAKPEATPDTAEVTPDTAAGNSGHSEMPPDTKPNGKGERVGKDGTVWNHAKKVVQNEQGQWGEISPVDGIFRRAGHWMPTHGLSVGQERAPKGQVKAGGDSGTPSEEGKGTKKEPRQRAPMTPEQIEELKSQREYEQTVRDVQKTPLGHLLNFEDNRDRMPRSKFVGLDAWRQYAESLGQDRLQQLTDYLQPIAERRASTPEELTDLREQHQWAEEGNRGYIAKKHQREHPSSLRAHTLLVEALENADLNEVKQIGEKLQQLQNESPTQQARVQIEQQAKQAGFYPNRFPGTTAEGNRVKAGEGFVKKNPQTGKYETYSADDVKKLLPKEAQGETEENPESQAKQESAANAEAAEKPAALPKDAESLALTDNKQTPQEWAFGDPRVENPNNPEDVRRVVRMKLAEGVKLPRSVLAAHPDLVQEHLNQQKEAKERGIPAHLIPKVDAALARYANRERTAQGGGLFGGEDVQAREGFVKLPDQAPIVFTEGEFQGRTGKIIHDEANDRIVAEVDGRPGFVPVTPDAVEPLDQRLSWRVEGGGSGAAPARQSGLFAGATPAHEAEELHPDVIENRAIMKELNGMSQRGETHGTIRGVPVERKGAGDFVATVAGKKVRGDLKYIASRIQEHAARKQS